MEKVSTARIALKWGLIYGLITIATNTLVYTFNLMENQWLSFGVGLIFSFGILYFAFSEFKTLNNGFMSFGQGVGLGALLFVTAGVIASIFDYVYKKFIDPSIIDKLVAIMEQQYEKMGMSPELIEQSIERGRPFIESPIAIPIAVLTIGFLGLIYSLIMAAIMKKTKPLFE